LYATDQGSYLVQGWKTGTPETIEIPHLLTGFAEKGTSIGAPMLDTGRGTFTVTGRPVTESNVLDQLSMEDHETAVEVPKADRIYYGGISTDD
jgi:hypothetical protein